MVRLSNENIEISNRKFYIDSIVDNRSDKSKIGIVQKGITNKKYPAQFCDHDRVQFFFGCQGGFQAGWRGEEYPDRGDHEVWEEAPEDH